MSKDNSTSQPAAEYDSNITKTIPYYSTIQAECIRLISQLKPRPASWLDTGCGTGNMAELAMQAFPKCAFTLADPSAAMLDIAKAKFKDQDCQFLQGKTNELELNPKSFTVITACLSHHYDIGLEKWKILSSCREALRPGGVYLTVETVAKDTSLGSQTCVELWRQAQLKAGKSEAAVTKHLSRLGDELAPISLREHFRLLKDVGFKNVELYWLSGMQAVFYATK